MDINKLTSLENKVSRQWAWRLIEIDKYKKLLLEHEKRISTPLSKVEDSSIDLLYRLGIVLLYSHWEGFIKNTAMAYMRCFKGEKIRNVPINIVVAHYIKTHDSYNAKCTAFECGKSVLEDIDIDKRVRRDIDDLVSAESNLNADVLSKIVSFLGIEKDWFELRKNYINNFVNCRNGIAHGDGTKVSKEEFYEYFNGIMRLIEIYKEKLLDFNRVQQVSTVS